MKALPDELREYVEEAKWIHAGFMIEAQSNDKEYSKKTLEGMIDKLREEKDIRVYDAKYEDTEEMRENWYSALVEVRVIAKTFGRIAHIALMYSPSSFEIYHPKEIRVPLGECQATLSDIAGVVTSLAHTIFMQKSQLSRITQAYEKLSGDTTESKPKEIPKKAKKKTSKKSKK